MQAGDVDKRANEDSQDWQFMEEAGELDADWEQVMQILPAHWQTKAVELGAVRRRLRSFSDVASVFRVLLIHLADGCSLRETVVRASAAGLADISAVALFKRLKRCGAWFEWMTQELAGAMALPQAKQALLAGRRVRLIDGSTVSEPAATGATWRLHYALNLHTLSCDEVHITSASEGESLTRYDIQAGEVVMADRGYANRRGLLHVMQRQADVVLRIGLHQITLHDDRQQPFNMLARLRKLRIGQAADWPAWVAPSKQGGSSPALAVRVCAYKKTTAQKRAAVQAIEKEARRKGKTVRPETIEAAGYVIVLTTLLQPSASAIMELYRRRWQVELAFKRLKSLLRLGHLNKTDPQSAKAWLQGKLLVACLIETLILTAERFSPWGYLDRPAEAAQALTLA